MKSTRSGSHRKKQKDSKGKSCQLQISTVLYWLPSEPTTDLGTVFRTVSFPKGHFYSFIANEKFTHKFTTGRLPITSSCLESTAPFGTLRRRKGGKGHGQQVAKMGPVILLSAAGWITALSPACAHCHLASQTNQWASGKSTQKIIISRNRNKWAHCCMFLDLYFVVVVPWSLIWLQFCCLLVLKWKEPAVVQRWACQTVTAQATS